MSEPLILTFDLGTQSMRALLVNAKGTILQKTQKAFDTPYYSRQPGWAEQKPEFYWECLCETSRTLKEKAGSLWQDIIAVTSATIRDTCLCLDKNHNPLRDIILWLDDRKAENLPPVPLLTGMIFGLAGMKDGVALQRRISHCNWIAMNEPEIWNKTDKYVLISTWLNYKFCGNLADSTASVIGHVPFDFKNCTWLKAGDMKRAIWEMNEDKFFDLVEPGTILGNITAKTSEETGIAAGLPYVVSGSDKGCETLGLSCLSEDKAALSFGTTATVQLATQRYIEPQLFMPAYPAVVPGYYNPEIEIYRGYWLLSWFKQEFAAKEVAEAASKGISAEQLLNERLQEIPPGCEGLVMQPYFTPGVNMPFAKGAIIGFSDVHTRIHIYRSIIEGINFALMEGLRGMEKRGKIKVSRIYVAGGGSQSAEICRITASQFGLPVYRTQTHEVTGIGAAMAAFVAKGIFSSYNEGIEAMVHVKDEFLPDQKVHSVYEEIYGEIFEKIFDKLSPLYAKLGTGKIPSGEN
ncbi:MAG: FGGY-family carbohydrate kinase [Treponema sp.]|nr:FGGY-family carbohydrate kinase [Treponema sp.]